MSIIKYDHSIANVPCSFLGFVVRPHNFCLQYQDVNVKLRVANNKTDDIIKFGPENAKGLPVTTDGAQVFISGNTTPIPMVEEIQEKLLEAYKTYYNLHNDYYTRTYNKQWLTFLKKTKVELERQINIIERIELEKELNQ